MKRPDLPADHCANQPPEMARKMFVQSIAPRLKGGSMDARSAISELEGWREYHPEVFADWEGLCWKYLQQPPEWVDWLIQGVRVTSGKVTKSDDLVAAAQAAADRPAAPHRRPTAQEQQDKGSNATFKCLDNVDQPERDIITDGQGLTTAELAIQTATNKGAWNTWASKATIGDIRHHQPIGETLSMKASDSTGVLFALNNGHY